MATILVCKEEELITKLSSHIEQIANDAIENRGKFFVGFSGKLLKVMLTLPSYFIYCLYNFSGL